MVCFCKALMKGTLYADSISSRLLRAEAEIVLHARIPTQVIFCMFQKNFIIRLCFCCQDGVFCVHLLFCAMQQAVVFCHIKFLLQAIINKLRESFCGFEASKFYRNIRMRKQEVRHSMSLKL